MILDADLLELDATAQASLVARGEVTPADLVRAAIAGIERHDGAINAVIHKRFDRALSEAEGELSGPFRGVPIVLKDCGCHSAGDPYHAGTRYLRRREWRSPKDSVLTRRFRAAGFIVIGRTNTPELAMSMTTEPLSYGPTRNPWNLDRSSGGSSGGSAAAVAARMVPVGHAGDGGGSLRIPASACGLVGLKPTRGRVSAESAADAWQGLLAEHVVCRTVRDTAQVLDAICERAVSEPSFASRLQPETPSFRVGCLDRPPALDVPADSTCSEAALAVGRLLADLGHNVELAYPDALAAPEFVPHFDTLVAVACRREVETLARLTGGNPDDELEPATRALADRGRAVSSKALAHTVTWLADFAQRVSAWWESGYDVLVCPTLNGPPPPIGWLSEERHGRARAEMLLPYVRAFNATGQPSLSLPLHWTDDGLPIGIQFTAAPGREDVLIAVAAQLEAALPWARRHPPAFDREAA